MTTDQTKNTLRRVPWARSDFFLAALLKDAMAVPEAPASLYKSVPWRAAAAVAASIVAATVLGAWIFFSSILPPELVREAMVHERVEAGLRGDFQKNKKPLLQALGLREGASLPGLLQLQRPCDIAGRTAYHVTTFIEKGGGMVTILAFEQPVPSRPSGQGRWLGRHWRFVEGTAGKTILMLADNAKALAETERLLKEG